MNPQSHRLVFNPTRGCLMAVAETSTSSGKSSASGATRLTRTKPARCPHPAEVQASNRPLATVSIAQAAINSIAGNNVNLEAAQNSQTNASFYKKTETGFSVDVTNGPGVTTSDLSQNGKSSTTTDVGSTIRSGANLTVVAGNSIGGTAATLQAGGTANLSAQGNIVLQEGRTTYLADLQQKRNDQHIFSGTETQRRATQDTSTALASKVSGTQGVTLQANQGTLYLSDVKVDSAGNVTLRGSDVILTSALNSSSQTLEEKTSRSGATINDVMATFQAGDGLGHERKDTVDDAHTTLAQGSVSGQNVSITSTGGANSQLALRAVEVSATGTPATPGTITLDAGAGTLKLQTIQTSDSHAVSMTESDLAWQGSSGSGKQTQNTDNTQLNGQLTTTAGNVQVEGAQTSLKEAVAQMATQPGMAWLDKLYNDPQLAGKVDWNKINEIHKNWHYDQAGLTPAGAVILAIVVTCLTSGSASSAASSMVASTSMTGATAAMATTALAAGMTALASQAAVAMVNNKGDIGKTLDQLGKEESIKNLLLTMVTAGALDKLNSTMGWQNINPKTADFASNFGKNVANNFASASINSALTGSSLEDGLKGALLNAVVSTSMAFGAKSIGGMTVPDANGKATLNPAGQLLAHALLGCVSGAATAGNGSGCTPGAAGAAVGELAAQWYDPTGDKTDAEVLDFVKVVSATAGALTGDGSAQSVNIAAATGVNAVQNNYLETRDVKRAIATLKNCTIGCDSLRRLLVSNESAGGEQTPVARLVDMCRANPQQCSTRVQDVAQALRELQSPEARAVIGAATADRLIQRQITDLGQALGALQWGADHMQSSTQIVKAALLVGSTAVGAGLLVNVGRALVTACVGGINPACSGMLTELGIGAAEAASGVPTLGLSAPVAAGAATRLKTVLSQTNDPAVVAQELQAVLAQAKIEYRALGDAAGGVKNPLLADAMPRSGDRLVLNQGSVPTCGANSCGMVLDTMGTPVDVATLIQKIPPTERGILPSQVATLMKSQGVDATALSGRNVADLTRYTEKGTPVVVRIADPGVSDFSHFVVVDGVTTRDGVQVVAIRDPQGAQYFSPVATFSKSFTGDVIVPR